MKESGETTKQMVKVNSGMQTEMFMKVNGTTIRLTDMDYIFISMVQNMKVNGKMISKMAGELKAGLMEANMKDNTRKV